MHQLAGFLPQMFLCCWRRLMLLVWLPLVALLVTMGKMDVGYTALFLAAISKVYRTIIQPALSQTTTQLLGVLTMMSHWLKSKAALWKNMNKTFAFFGMH